MQRQRQENVLAAGEVINELKVLKQVADLLAAVVGQRFSVQRRDALAVQCDAPAVGAMTVAMQLSSVDLPEPLLP